jgi:allophanate hydrolase subunit 1
MRGNYIGLKLYLAYINPDLQPAEIDAKPGQKRTMSEAGLDIASILKKRKIGSNTLIKSPPDEQILVPMRGLFSSGFVYQKQVADEIGIR